MRKIHLSDFRDLAESAFIAGLINFIFAIILLVIGEIIRYDPAIFAGCGAMMPGFLSWVVGYKASVYMDRLEDA